MCEKLNRKDFHEAIDTTLSGLQADPWLAQRVLHAERNAKVIINKRTLVLIFYRATLYSRCSCCIVAASAH